MSEPSTMWHQTAAAFDQRHQAISEDQWAAPTPCDEWTVRDLVDHVVGAQVAFGSLLGAEATADAGWPAVRAAVSEVLGRADALDGEVQTPLGTMTKAQVLSIMSHDMVLHTWDLSRAIGADESLPADSVAACHAWLRQMPAEAIRESGRFKPPLDPPADADAQTELLAFAGRPAWSRSS